MNEVLGAIQHLDSNKNTNNSSQPSTNPLKFINDVVVGVYGQISDLEKELSQAVQNNSESQVYNETNH